MLILYYYKVDAVIELSILSEYGGTCSETVLGNSTGQLYYDNTIMPFVLLNYLNMKRLF